MVITTRLRVVKINEARSDKVKALLCPSPASKSGLIEMTFFFMDEEHSEIEYQQQFLQKVC